MGSLLVAFQFILIGIIAWLAASAFLDGTAPLFAWLMAAVGLAIGAWALTANRPGNFNIRPTPRVGGQLVRGGPYRWIRHPMYTCVALCAVAGAWAAGSAMAWSATVALAGVLLVKADLEERSMASQHPEYAAYRARTRRFLPWLF